MVVTRVNKKWLKSPSSRRRRPGASSASPSDRHKGNMTPRRRRSSATRRTPEPKATAASKPKPKSRPGCRAPMPSTSSTPGTGSGSGLLREGEPHLLTMQEAVHNWLVWLGMGEIEHRILDNFIAPPDQLTSALALTGMIQQLTASIGGILQDGMQMSARRHRTTAEDEVVEVAVDGEGDEVGLMQTGLLAEIRQGLEGMTKDAGGVTISWLRRRVHHRCTDTRAGYLMGHLRGRPGDLVALLAGGAEDLEGTTVTSVACSSVTLQWWSPLEPHLPISTCFQCYSRSLRPTT